MCLTSISRLISINYFSWKLYKCIACAVFFLEMVYIIHCMVYIIQRISAPLNRSLQILRKVWNNSINLHMQVYMQNYKNLQFYLQVQISTHIAVCVFWFILQIFSIEWWLILASPHPASSSMHTTENYMKFPHCY